MEALEGLRFSGRMRLRVLLRYLIGDVSIGIPHLLFAWRESPTNATVRFDAVDVRLKIRENCHLTRERIGRVRALDLCLNAFYRRQVIRVVGTERLCEHKNAV